MLTFLLTQAVLSLLGQQAPVLVLRQSRCRCDARCAVDVDVGLRLCCCWSGCDAVDTYWSSLITQQALMKPLQYAATNSIST